MRKLFSIFVISLFLNTVAAHAQSHPDVVASVRATLVAQGVSINDSCGAFQITKRVAWALRAEGAGLLDKPAGNNCQGYSVDVITYPGGRAFDILSDAGGTNGPSWQDISPIDASRYRPAIDPGDAPAPFPFPVPTPVPTPQPAPTPAPVDLTPVILRLDSLYAQAERIFAAQEAEVAARSAQLNEIDQRVQQHIEETHSFISKVGGFFTDGKTIAAIVGGLGTFLVSTQTHK